MRRRSRRPGALGYDSWQGDPIVMPPRDAADAEAIAAILAADGGLVLCRDAATPEQEASNRRCLADGIAAAGRMAGPNREEWRRMYLRHLVSSFCALTYADFDASIAEGDRLRRELGIADDR